MSAAVGQLVAAVAAALPQAGQSERLESRELEGKALPPAVHSVTVHRYDSMDRSYWLGSDAEWGTDLTASLVQERIDAKHCKVALYRPEEWPVWLLVVMDSRRFSGMMHVPEALRSHSFASQFHQVYLLDVLNRRTWLLNRVDHSGRPA